MGAKSAQELKGLQTREQRLLADIEAAKQDQKAMNDSLTAMQKQLSSVRSQIKQLQQDSAEPVVSEHALLRYLERAKGIDLDAVRAEILDGRAEAIKAMRNGKINSGGLSLVVQNCTVVSVVPS